MGKFGEIDDGKWKNLAFRLKFCYIDYFVVILSVSRSIHLQSLALWQKTQHKILILR